MKQEEYQEALDLISNMNTMNLLTIGERSLTKPCVEKLQQLIDKLPYWLELEEGVEKSFFSCSNCGKSEETYNYISGYCPDCFASAQEFGIVLHKDYSLWEDWEGCVLTDTDGIEFRVHAEEYNNAIAIVDSISGEPYISIYTVGHVDMYGLGIVDKNTISLIDRTFKYLEARELQYSE